MSSVVCLHDPHGWTKKSIKIHSEHAWVCAQHMYVCCVRARVDARAASGDLRKVTLGAFVLHASCMESGTVGNTRDVDDLYCVTLRRTSDTRPRSHRLGLKHIIGGGGVHTSSFGISVSVVLVVI